MYLIFGLPSKSIDKYNRSLFAAVASGTKFEANEAASLNTRPSYARLAKLLESRWFSIQ